MAPEHGTTARFLRFGLVGVAGFIVDAGLTQGLVDLAHLPPLAARLPAFVAAVLTTWALNRRFTFADRKAAPAGRQFLAFVASALIAGVVNYAVFAAVTLWTPLGAWPAVGVAFGSVAGWLVNFTIADRLVFRHGDDAAT